MFGLIKQLAKLITIAKNLPKIPPLVTQLTKPEDIALTLAMGMVGDEIEEMVQSNSQNLAETTQVLQQNSQQRIQEIQSSNASEEIKQQEINRITWASRRETMYASLSVFVMALIASLFFFLVDLLLSNIVQFLLGFGG